MPPSLLLYPHSRRGELLEKGRSSGWEGLSFGNRKMGSAEGNRVVVFWLTPQGLDGKEGHSHRQVLLFSDGEKAVWGEA